MGTRPAHSLRSRFIADTQEVHAALRAGRRAAWLAGGLVAGPARRRSASTAPSTARSRLPACRGRRFKRRRLLALRRLAGPYFDALWLPDRSHYRSGNSTVGRIYHNSAAAHDARVAALAGHNGPCRHDDRARALAPPPVRLAARGASATHRPSGDPQFHKPGWVESMGTRDAAMDKSIDPKVAEALMYAWRARDVLQPARRRPST